MANPEHVQLLKRPNWNKWRADHPDISPDLSRADLSRTELKGVNLDRTNLAAAHLAAADLRGAHLTAADLRGADLNGADLGGAFLSAANLSAAKLRGADLSEAILIETNFSWANLVSANLIKARLAGTDFGAASLLDAKGLEECEFLSPCILDHQALQRSGALPVRFLRGCGLPDSLIEYLPSLLNQAIQFFSCFISYSTNDEGFAERLHADLQDRGVRCWFAPEDLKIGDRFQECIEESIRLFDKVMIVLSEASVHSRWVEREVNAAREREDRDKRTVLLPIRVDDTVMNAPQAWAADIRRSRHIGDFSRWKEHDHYQRAFERLLRDLKAGAENEATA